LIVKSVLARRSVEAVAAARRPVAGWVPLFPSVAPAFLADLRCSERQVRGSEVLDGVEDVSNFVGRLARVGDGRLVIVELALSIGAMARRRRRRGMAISLRNVLVEDRRKGAFVPRTNVVGRPGDVLASDDTDALAVAYLDRRGLVVRAPGFVVDRERGAFDFLGELPPMQRVHAGG
jgi:hypothetical protein